MDYFRSWRKPERWHIGLQKESPVDSPDGYKASTIKLGRMAWAEFVILHDTLRRKHRSLPCLAP